MSAGNEDVSARNFVSSAWTAAGNASWRVASSRIDKFDRAHALGAPWPGSPANNFDGVSLGDMGPAFTFPGRILQLAHLHWDL
jgi:hypothetical protein